jgi:antitoxin VapB
MRQAEMSGRGPDRRAVVMGAAGVALTPVLVSCGGGDRTAPSPRSAPVVAAEDLAAFAAARGEIEEKVDRVRALLAARKLGAIRLRRVSSFAWATGGADSAINTATDVGVGELIVTRDHRYLVTSNIEAPRFEKEDRLGDQGWEPAIAPWYETGDPTAAVTKGLAVGADSPVAGAVDLTVEIGALRAHLVEVESARFRELARRCASAMDAAVRAIRPGMSERQIASLLAGETAHRGVWPVVDLVATDERIRHFRHPLPVDKALERHAMVVLCGRKWGLVCSLTRFVHFGRLPDDLRRRQDAVAQVDATFIAATRPGAAVKDVFARALGAYRATGFADEWTLHHQGGAAGYEPREYIGRPSSTEQVAERQAFAWNPSITGAKSEDTILVGRDRNDVMTEIAGWPTIDPTIDGATWRRPAVLEIT